MSDDAGAREAAELAAQGYATAATNKRSQSRHFDRLYEVANAQEDFIAGYQRGHAEGSARVAELVEALAEYGEHDVRCAVFRLETTKTVAANDARCTCGLREALEGR